MEKLPLEQLMYLENEELYNYMKSVDLFDYTRDELLDLMQDKQIPIQKKTKAVNRDLLDAITETLRFRVLLDAMNIINHKDFQGTEITALLFQRDVVYRFHFVKKYGQYFSANELISLLKYDCEVNEESINEILLDVYIQKKQTEILRKQQNI